jgi:hypothetical protein
MYNKVYIPHIIKLQLSKDHLHVILAYFYITINKTLGAITHGNHVSIFFILFTDVFLYTAFPLFFLYNGHRFI